MVGQNGADSARPHSATRTTRTPSIRSSVVRRPPCAEHSTVTWSPAATCSCAMRWIVCSIPPRTGG